MTATAREVASMRRDDDVVLQRPADVRLAIPVFKTPTACAGAAASYVLRRIAYRAGAYAPGIHESIFHELHDARAGGALDDVERWFAGRLAALHELGYRLQSRRVTSPTDELLAWVEGGRGYRGALLATSYAVLHPPGSPAGDVGDVIVHAVGLTSEAREAGGAGELVLIDPWSRAAELRARVVPGLERARRARAHHAIALHWVGWA